MKNTKHDTKHIEVVGEQKFSYKFHNVIKGVLHKPKLIYWFFRVYFYNFKQCNVKSFSVRMLIVFSRIGFRENTSGYTVDEGVFQSLWGAMHQFEINTSNVNLITEIIDIIGINGCIHYVFTHKATYIERIKDRERKHPFNTYSECDTEKARNWMALIIKTSNSKNVTFKSYRN